jgi:hypothetical protein
MLLYTSTFVNTHQFAVTGLDLAGPLFKNQDCRVRLCKGDAKFVEVLLTNEEYVYGLGSPQDDCKHTLSRHLCYSKLQAALVAVCGSTVVT